MGRRILAVDDNEIVGWTLAARLWAAGYDVEAVRSAAEAFEALKAQTYDLVLMDLEMPEMDGLQALEVLRQEHLLGDASVVLLTASEELTHVQRAYAKGAKGYLTKGRSALALIKDIKRLMDGDDVLWIDDEHCVSSQSISCQKTSCVNDRAPLALVSAASPADSSTFSVA